MKSKLENISLTKQNIIRFIYFACIILLVLSAYYTYDDALLKGDDNTKYTSFAFMIICIIWASIQLKNLTYRFFGGDDNFWMGVVVFFNLLFLATYCLTIYYGTESSYYTNDEPWFYVFCIAGFLVFFLTLIEWVVTPEYMIANTIKDVDTGHYQYLRTTSPKDYVLKQIHSIVIEQKKNFKGSNNPYGALSNHIGDVLKEKDERKKNNLIRYLTTKIDDKTSFALNNIPTADGPFRWNENGKGDKISFEKPISISKTYEVVNELKRKGKEVYMFNYGESKKDKKDRDEKTDGVEAYDWDKLNTDYKNELAKKYVNKWFDENNEPKNGRENNILFQELTDPKKAKIDYKCGLLSFAPVIAMNENTDIVQGTRC